MTRLKRISRVGLLFALTAMLLGACSDDTSSEPDSGRLDAALDTSMPDTSVPDSGQDADAGTTSCPNVDPAISVCTTGLASMLVCTEGGELEIPCRGPAGCQPGTGAEVSCDQTQNEEGDRCLVSQCHCDPDGSQTLCCGDDGFFQRGFECIGNSCVQAGDDIVACETP